MSVIGYKLHVHRESAENIQVTKHSIKTQLMNRPSTKHLQKNNVYAEYSNKFQKKSDDKVVVKSYYSTSTLNLKMNKKVSRRKHCV